MSALTDAERVALSLSENIDRAEMSAIETFKAFNQLFKAGLSVPKIAEQFSTDERTVQQYLAIGSLPKKILNLAEEGEIGDKTLTALAIAPGKDVVRYSKLKANERPSDWRINEWLRGEKGWFPSEYALFNLDTYKGGKVRDLFDEDREYLTDGDQAWDLQRQAVNKEIEKLADLGWKIEQVEFFNNWAYDKTSKKDGGKVYYTINRNGQVEWHKGYLAKKQAGKTPKAKNGKAEEKPEISQAMQTWMDELRFTAVAAHMIYLPKQALAPIVMLLMTEADNIQFRHQGCPIKSDKALDSFNKNENVCKINESWHEMLKELGLKGGNSYNWNRQALLKKLMKKTPGALMKYLAITVAYNWRRVDNKAMEAVASALNIKQVNTWEHDDAFWASINNKQTLLKIAKDQHINVNEKATTKELRKAISAKIMDDWRPDWLRF